MREMKDSGVEWIGEIPKAWEVARIKHLFAEVNERCENGDDYTLLSVSEYYGVSPRVEKIEEDDLLTHANTLDNYKICRIDDIVINIMLAWKSALGVCSQVGIVSPAYCVYRPVCEMNVKYFHFLFRTKQYADVFKQYSTGVIDSRLRLYTDKFFSLYCQVPPLEEQTRIADYLDAKCAQIDRAIARQQEVIEKLKEYKLSVITEAVTKGLNPDVPMKDSGIEWIGEIPEHWEARKIRWDFTVDLGKMLDAKQISGQFLRDYLRNTDVQWNSINFENLPQMDFQDTELERYQIKPGDLLVCEGGEIGRCAIVPEEFPAQVFYQKALHRVRIRKVGNGDVGFLSYVLFCMSRNQYFFDSPEKATIAHLPAETLNGLRIPSPRKDEQIDIVRFLNNECGKIDEVAKKKQQIIDKLTEYKKSLIYEVVTGKREI